MADATLPAQHKVLVQEVYGEPLVVKHHDTPQPGPGSALVKILYAPIISYMREVYNGEKKYPYITPMVPGTNAIGRIVATGPDAVSFKSGELVYIDCMIRARDDPGAIILLGLVTGRGENSIGLMEREWRNGTFAEYAKVPLENVFRLDENRLCGSPTDGGLGYFPQQLSWLMSALVPFGGLRSIALQPGETVLIAPATGGFGSAGVVVALSMGARVIAMGRNAAELAKLKALGPRVETVVITNDEQEDLKAIKKFGVVDAYFDISPTVAGDPSHVRSGIQSLRNGGRVAFMGGLENITIPHRFIMRFDITLKGKWMYTREDQLTLIKMFETGVLDVRDLVKIVGEFKLEDWKEALDVAADAGRLGEVALFTP